jgi:predicted unusual protein kinase regulating ubiquinone biosynthesis (AarF/ABC1/UbiB family)
MGSLVPTMIAPSVNRRKRIYKILRLFFSLVASFFLQYLRARLAGHSYDFFVDSEHNRRRAIQLRNAALDMGGVLIKVGQFLSSRVDLLPTEYIEELALLQDEVPAVPFEDIRSVLEHDLGGPLESFYQSLDPVPLAAASLGQVHRGTLPTGETVAVKVQRPYIDQVVEADLTALRYVVTWLHRHTPISKRADLPLILKEFEVTLRLELDYQREGHHAERASVMFANTPQVEVPRIYWSHSIGRVLTMQRMTGSKITAFEELAQEEISRPLLAEILMQAYLKQILEFGFFHADPHPGNIFVKPGPTVVLLDFGMVGDISPPMREEIRRAFLGVVRRDFDAVLLALDRLGFLTPAADLGVLRRALAWTVDTFYEMSFEELRGVDPQRVLDQLQDVFYTESVRIPANFAFLGRALGTLSGLCTALDPSFQFVTVAEPYARELVQSRRGMVGVVEQVAGEARSLAATAYSLPYLSRRVLERVQNGELGIRHEMDEVVRAVDRLERAMRRILYGLLVTGFVVAGAFVFPTRYPFLAVGAFLISFIFLLGVLYPFRSRRQ